MSNYAKIENNIVANIVKIPDDFDTDHLSFLASLGYIGEWVKTPTENGSEAALGFFYQNDSKQFIAKQPSELHILLDGNWIIPKDHFENDAPPPPPNK